MKAGKDGRSRSGKAGSDAAQTEIAAVEAAAAARLQYVDFSPNGRLGYVLPEGDRTLCCLVRCSKRPVCWRLTGCAAPCTVLGVEYRR